MLQPETMQIEIEVL